MSELVLRGLAPDGFKAMTSAVDPGPAPMLQWVAIGDLRIDDAYQRPIRGAGQKNVRFIAENFCWSKFAPLIVAPIAGGLFAIIDGQHRATAAAMRGHLSVPAQVVIADSIAQAAAFRAVNGQVTKMHPLELHRAAIAAGDPEAIAVKDVCTAAGVVILRHPRAVDRLSPGETFAVGAITNQYRQLASGLLEVALKCVTQSSQNKPGMLSSVMVDALCATTAPTARWRSDESRLFAAFDDIDLEFEREEARITRKSKGVATWEVLADRLSRELKRLLG